MWLFILLALPGLLFVIFVVAVAVRRGRREVEAAGSRDPKGEDGENPTHTG